MQVRTVAAIMVWSVVLLLLVNRFFNSEVILPISLVLTGIAVFLYFSPRIMKNKKSSEETETVST